MSHVPNRVDKYFLILASRKVGPKGRVIGVDMTDEMIEKANGNIRAAKINNVEVRKGLIEDLPVEDASVNWVISNCVINLSPEKPKVFRENSRVLKPGGQMLVSDIVAKDLPEELRTIRRVYSRQMEKVRDAVARHFPPGSRVTRPAGGFVLWVEMPEGVDTSRLYEEAKKKGIGIAPGTLFSTAGRYGNCIRLNTAFWSERVEQALETVGEMAGRMV